MILAIANVRPVTAKSRADLRLLPVSDRRQTCLQPGLEVVGVELLCFTPYWN